MKILSYCFPRFCTPSNEIIVINKKTFFNSNKSLEVYLHKYYWYPDDPCAIILKSYHSQYNCGSTLHLFLKKNTLYLLSSAFVCCHLTSFLFRLRAQAAGTASYFLFFVVVIMTKVIYYGVLTSVRVQLSKLLDSF